MVGYLALFIALSATAYALPGRNTVDSGDIKTGQVKTRNLARGTVTRSKLAPNSVDSSKVIDNSLTGADINESTLNLPAQPATLPPSGPAGGDLSGQYPNPQVQESTLTTGGGLSGPLSNAAVDTSKLTVGGGLTGSVSNATVDTSKLTVGGGLTGSVSNATVDTSKLTVGGDLTGTASNAQIGAGVVGDAEIADRTADLSVPAQELLPLVGRAGTTATATDIPTSNVPALAFSSTADQQVEFVIRVPADRVASSSMTVSVDWSATLTGLPDWKLDYLPLSSSAVNGAFKSGGSGGVTSFSSNFITVFCCLTLPSTDLFNGGDVVVRLTRTATDATDNLSAPARVEAIEFTYTAKR